MTLISNFQVNQSPKELVRLQPLGRSTFFSLYMIITMKREHIGWIINISKTIFINWRNTLNSTFHCFDFDNFFKKRKSNEQLYIEKSFLIIPTMLRIFETMDPPRTSLTIFLRMKTKKWDIAWINSDISPCNGSNHNIKFKKYLTEQ